MKNLVKILLFVIVAMATTTTFAQINDTIWVYNTNIDNRIIFEEEYNFNEINSLILTSRVAFLDDAKEMINYYFQDQGIKNVFWEKAVQRYIEWPKEAEKADALGEYYHPKCMIYIPIDDYINAIVFDWSSRSEDIKIAIFCEDGLWTTKKSLGDKWEVFIDDSFVKMIISMENE